MSGVVDQQTNYWCKINVQNSFLVICVFKTPTLSWFLFYETLNKHITIYILKEVTCFNSGLLPQRTLSKSSFYFTTSTAKTVCVCLHFPNNILQQVNHVSCVIHVYLLRKSICFWTLCLPPKTIKIIALEPAGLLDREIHICIHKCDFSHVSLIQ